MRNNKGYTLLEVLIALAVFAILAVITSNALYQGFNTRARVTLQAARLNQLQLALIIVERDINQAIIRPVQGSDHRTFSPFIGLSQYIEFSRGGFVNPESLERRSTIKRVALQCKGNKLVRRTWDTLDTPNRNKFNDHVLLNKVMCKFAYVNHTQQVMEEWHETSGGNSEEQLEPLPSAIKITLNFPDWGEMSLLFIIPEALYA